MGLVRACLVWCSYEHQTSKLVASRWLMPFDHPKGVVTAYWNGSRGRKLVGIRAKVWTGRGGWPAQAQERGASENH